MLVLATAVVLATVVSADQPTSAPRDRIVCKMIRNPDLGSNIRKRKKTCMLASDWEELETLTERAKLQILNGKTRGPGPPNSQSAGVGAGGPQ